MVHIKPLNDDCESLPLGPSFFSSVCFDGNKPVQMNRDGYSFAYLNPITSLMELWMDVVCNLSNKGTIQLPGIIISYVYSASRIYLQIMLCLSIDRGLLVSLRNHVLFTFDISHGLMARTSSLQAAGRCFVFHIILSNVKYQYQMLNICRRVK